MLFSRPLVVTHTVRNGTASDRPVARAEDVEPDGDAPPPAERTRTGDLNLGNILVLIPGESVSAYLAIKDLGADPVVGIPWPALAFWLCLVACLALRLIAINDGTGKKLGFWGGSILILVTAVAFVIWAHAVNQVGPLIPSLNGKAAAAIAFVFGLFAPKLVPAVPATTSDA